MLGLGAASGSQEMTASTALTQRIGAKPEMNENENFSHTGQSGAEETKFAPLSLSLSDATEPASPLARLQ